MQKKTCACERVRRKADGNPNVYYLQMSVSRLLYGLLSQRRGNRLSPRSHASSKATALCAVHHEII